MIHCDLFFQSDSPGEGSTLFWAILGVILVLAIALLIALVSMLLNFFPSMTAGAK
jgi:hypothetical protein